MITIWIIFAFFGGEWHEMNSSFASQRSCAIFGINSSGDNSGYVETREYGIVPAVCRSRRVPAPPK